MESLLCWHVKNRLVLEVIDLRVRRHPCLIEYDFVLISAAERRCRVSVESGQLCEVEGVRVKFRVRSLPAEGTPLAFGVQFVLWTMLIFPPVPEFLQAMGGKDRFQSWKARAENGDVDLNL